MSPGPDRRRVAAAIGDDLEAWVVGGPVRDELLGRDSTDLDLAVAAEPGLVARLLGRELNRPAFELSAEFGTWRVAGDGWQIDCTGLQGQTIEDDLARRDLTINAMAIPLSGGDVIDPCGGKEDLAGRRIRMVSERSFTDDPLRVVRVARFAAELGFEVDPETARVAAQRSGGLRSVAGERVFAELVQLLGSARPGDGLLQLEATGAMAVVLPELVALRGVEQNRYHHLDVFDHTMLVLERAIAVCDDPAAYVPGLADEVATAIKGHLAQPLADGMTRELALRLGALLHDIAKPRTQARSEEGVVLGFPHHAQEGRVMSREILTRLKASERLRAHIAALAEHHLGLGFLVHAEALDARAIYRYLSATAPVHVDVSLLSIADRLATGGHKAELSTGRHLAVAGHVLPAAAAFDDFRALPPLVRGDRLALALAIRPGPELGELLASVAEARYVGEISTEQEAIAWARTLVAAGE